MISSTANGVGTIFLALGVICSTLNVTSVNVGEIPHKDFLEQWKFTNDVVSDDNFSGHLEKPIIRQICTSNRSICDTADDKSPLCTVRILKGLKEERGFESWCYLFLSNMCDNPGQEYLITFPDVCEKYHSYRRKSEPNVNVTRQGNSTDVTNSTLVDMNHMNNTKMNATLRSDDSTFSRSSKTRAIKKMKLRNDDRFAKKYDIDQSFDEGHVCPHSCPEHYKPVCLNVNQGGGAKMRFYTFVNHCKMDLYYCEHHKEFKLKNYQDDDEDEDELQYSQLGWTYCASTRYTQFARFAESVSSMGHFGWLAGDYKYSHIMEPHERMPGFGKK